MTDADDDHTFPEYARLTAVTLDEASLGRDSLEVEHEREVALHGAGTVDPTGPEGPAR